MPRTNASHRQKNKPFKHSKAQTKKAPKTKKTKQIAKLPNQKRTKHTRQELLQKKKQQKNKQFQELTTKNQYLDTTSKEAIKSHLKQEEQIKIVLLLPCNFDANNVEILENLFKSLNADDYELRTNINGMKCPSLEIFPKGNKTFLKSNIHILAPPRDLQSLLDYAKIADIICPILSCKSTNVQGINLDPHQEAKAFDETGYITLNILRSLGLQTTISIVQHLQCHDNKHRDKVQKIFKRFFNSQLSENQKTVNLAGNLQDYQKLLRFIDFASINIQPWKASRGYMLVEDITHVQMETGSITLKGFLKGNCIHANQLVHVTGFDDYELQKIQILTYPNRTHRKQTTLEEETNLIQYSTKSESLYPFAKKQHQKEQSDLLSALQQLKLGHEEQKKTQKIQEEDDQFEDVQEEQISYQEGDEAGLKQEQRAKRVQMQMRKQDELQFQDQVEYAAQQNLRQKFKDYQGLKSFKKSEWNYLENLPDEYDRIYSFRHYNKILNGVLSRNKARAFAHPGFYISITIKNFPIKQLENYLLKYPLIVTFLLEHQRKMTQVHAKVRRNPYYSSDDTIVQSNKKYMISLGFRKVILQPIFSRVIDGTDKTKYTKKISQDSDSYYYCSFYYYNQFPPTPILIFGYSMDSLETSPIMHGQLIKCDPRHIILERIILTGYPFKIYKRRSTVRFMFFNPKDVKYFKPVQVKTKLGLRGRIEQSLGTHGLMKCIFNDRIKHNDTVCMYLYRRVYPNVKF